MSGDDRRASCWRSGEQRMKEALRIQPDGNGTMPPEYWRLLAEANVLAALASAPYDVALPLAFYERDEEREREETLDDARDLFAAVRNGDDK
jgi:hypothetical protein